MREQDVAECLAAGATVSNSSIHEAIGRTPGVSTYTLASVMGGLATAGISLAANEYPTIVAAGITWT